MKKILISAVAASVLSGVALQAASLQPAGESGKTRAVMHHTQGGLQYFSRSDKAVKGYIAQELERHHQKVMQGAPKEILDAFAQTYRAVKMIQAGENDKALKALESADKAFDEALKKHPELKMIPLSEQIFVSELEASADEIKKAVDYSRLLLKGYHTQAAGALVSTLNDEMDIATTYLPMQLYPKAVKKAIEALKKGDRKGAVEALGAGLGTVVTVEAAVPLPLLAARDLILQAAHMDKKEKQKIEKLLAAAKEELRKAYYLGYTDLHPGAYNDLMRQILAIEKEMGGANNVESLYKKIQGSFDALVGQAYRDSVERKEAQALKNPAAVSGEPSAKAKLEEEQAKELFEAKIKAPLFEQEAKSDANKTVH